MLRLLVALVLVGTVTAGCSTTAERQVRAGAYESCKALSGEARDRCIEAETQRLRLDQQERNQACLEEIARQEDRSAMIKGERTGDPDTSAFGGGCDGGAVATRFQILGN